MKLESLSSWLIFIAAVVAAIIFCCTSTPSKSDESEEYSDDYTVEYDKGFDAGYDFGYDFGYDEGFDAAYSDFENAVSRDAIFFVRETCEWHPEEAVCIIESYENGEEYYGNYQITEKDYKDAVESLCRYYDYFYSQLYEEDVNKY